MKQLKKFFLLIILIVSIGCGSENKILNTNKYKSESYGFSFIYPSNWIEVTKDLPDKWAILNGEDTIIFTVNSANSNEILNLGKAQAIRDFYSKENINNLDQEEVDKVTKIVKLEEFNKRAWYTYAIKFSENNVNSIVSGTICEDKEINLVMVSGFGTYEANKLIYRYLLESFKC